MWLLDKGKDTGVGERMKFDELENWLFDRKKELLVYGIDLSEVEVSVNRVAGKQVLNLRIDGELEATKVWWNEWVNVVFVEWK